jgi:hypothetical protein
MAATVCPGTRNAAAHHFPATKRPRPSAERQQQLRNLAAICESVDEFANAFNSNPGMKHGLGSGLR